MILKEIYLYPDLVEFDRTITSVFRDQTRAICNYIERHVSKEKIETSGFKRICFVGKKCSRAKPYINSTKVLVIEIPFRLEEYQSINKSNLNSYFLGLIKSGTENCGSEYGVPIALINKIGEEFLHGGEINCWVFKKRKFRELDLDCELHCKLDLDAFSLNLVIKRKGAIIFSEKILNAPPDEIVYKPMFKDVVLSSGTISVVDKYDDSIFSIDTVKFIVDEN